MPELPPATSSRLTLRRGALRIPRQVYDLYFAGREAVILLPREDRLLILPVAHAGGGGHLLKVATADGDRSVHAGDLLRTLGVSEDLLEGSAEASFEARWSTADAALVLERLSPAQRGGTA